MRWVESLEVVVVDGGEAELGRCMDGDGNVYEVMGTVLMILSVPLFRYCIVSTKKSDDEGEEGIENGKETEIVVQSKGK